jgi:hypothetical protein
MTEGNFQIVTLHMYKLVYVDKPEEKSTEDVQIDLKVMLISFLQSHDVTSTI